MIIRRATDADADAPIASSIRHAPTADAVAHTAPIIPALDAPIASSIRQAPTADAVAHTAPIIPAPDASGALALAPQ